MLTCHSAGFAFCKNKFFESCFLDLIFIGPAGVSGWFIAGLGLFIYEGHIWYWHQWPQLGR